MFLEVAVTTTPVDLSALLGVSLTGHVGTSWRIQNRGPENVYRAQSVAAPVPAAVRDFRHAESSLVEVRIPSNDLGGATWAWTASGVATIIVEDDIL